MFVQLTKKLPKTVALKSYNIKKVLISPTQKNTFLGVNVYVPET